MTNQAYNEALIKLLCAESYFLCQMNASREMYAKSYFALGAMEKQAVDQTVLNSVGAILTQITPQWLGVADPAPKGFQAPQQDSESS